MKNNSLYDIEYFQKMKAAHKLKQKRVKRRRIILIVAIVLILIYLITPLSRINSITIKGENIYSEKKVEQLAQVSEGQFTFLHPAFLIKNNLEKTNLFSEVKVSKSLFGDVNIDIVENKLLFYAKENNKIVFYDKGENKLTFDKKQEQKLMSQVGELVSNVDEDIKSKMVEKLGELDSSVVSLISQIQHTPKKYDNEYFTFIMNDDKKIYIYATLDDIVKVGANYHNFAANTKYKCNIIEFINSENKAIVKKC